MVSNNSNINYSDSVLTGKEVQSQATNIAGGLPYVVQQSSSFDVVYWIVKLLRYWYILLIMLIIAVGLAFLKNQTWVPLFLTKTTLLIQEDKTGAGFGMTIGSFAAQATQNNNNQMIMYQSYDLVVRAVNKLNITSEIFRRGKFRTANLYKRSPIEIESNFISDEAYGMEFRIVGLDGESYEILFAGDDRKPKFKVTGEYGKYLQHELFFVLVNKTDLFTEDYDLYFRFVSKGELINSYYSRLRVALFMEGSSVMEATLVGTIAQRDVDFLNALNYEFFADNLERKNESSKRAVDFINERLLVIRDSISTSEAKLNEFQMKTGVFSSQDRSTRANAELENLTQRKVDMKLQREYLNELAGYLKRNTNELLVAPFAMGIMDNQLGSLVEKYNEIVTQLKTLKPENPIYVRYTTQMQDVKTALEQAVQTKLRALGMEERSVGERFNKMMTELSALPEKERELLTRERDFKINDSYHTYLLQRRIESQIQMASNAPDNSILNQPRAVGPINRGEVRNTYVVFVGVVFALFIILIVCKELIFNLTIQSREELEKFGLPVIGTIEHSDKKNQMVVKSFPKSGFAEGFRNLRSRMEYITKKESPISMLLTSTEPKDGKTFIATNLASVYQLTGKRTVIVDFDLRRPAMSKTLGVENEKGLSNYLIGQVTLQEIIVTHPDYEFDVISAGTIPPNPSELIRSDKTSELIKKLHQMYDYIILDCSPVGLVSDAYFLARQVDTLLYVVRNEKTNRNFLRYTINELRDDNINNMAIVYNDVNLRSGYSGYGSRRYYGRSSYYIKHDSYYHDDYLES